MLIDASILIYIIVVDFLAYILLLKFMREDKK